jgi:nucleotide-binding universal stress UspA family protein
MAFKKNILVIANVTATSDELCSILIERAKQELVAFTILVPATSAAGGHAAAQEQVEAAVARLREAGLEASGSVGDRDPIVAISEAWDPRHYDEIVMSTLPIGASKWLRAGLPERISKLTGTLVTHIVSEPPRAPVEQGSPPRHADKGLGPLTVLGWGGRHADKCPPDART